MARRYRSFSKSSMLKTLSSVTLEGARYRSRERRRWRPRVVLAFVVGVICGYYATLLTGMLH